MNKMIILIGNKLSSRGLNPTSIEKLSEDLEVSYRIESASDKKNYIHASGVYSVDNNNYQNYDFKNDFLNETSNSKATLV